MEFSALKSNSNLFTSLQQSTDFEGLTFHLEQIALISPYFVTLLGLIFHDPMEIFFQSFQQTAFFVNSHIRSFRDKYRVLLQSICYDI